MIKDKNYSTFLGRSCITFCLAAYLRYYGYNITEADIAFFSEKFDVIYKLGTKSCDDYIFVTGLDNCWFKFLDANKVKYKMGALQSSDDGRAFLSECVLQEIPLTLEVKNGFLDYHEIFGRSPEAIHFINIIGFDKRKSCISDGYIPVDPPQMYQGEIETDKLLKAWSAAGSRYFCWEIERGSEQLSEIHGQLAEKIKKILILYLKGGVEKSQFYGIDVIKGMSYELANIMEYVAFKEWIMKLNHELKIKGFLFFKRLISEAVEVIANETKNDDLESICEKCQESIMGWNKISMQLIRFSMTGKSKQLKSIVETIDNLSEIEKELYEEIINIL